MGVLFSCCGGGDSYTDINNDLDQETRRRQMAEAAEARMRSQEGRGVRDPEALKQRQRRMEELEKKQQMAGNDSGGLRWQVG